MRFLRLIKKYIPTWVIVVGAISLISLLLLALSVYISPLADFLNATVATVIRSVMAAVSHLLPFSIFELIVVLALPAIVLITVIILRDNRGRTARIRSIMALLGVVGIIFSGYILIMAIPYRTTPLADKIGIEDRTDISAEELYGTALIVRDEVNALADSVAYEDGQSHMGCSVYEMSEKITEAYSEVYKKYPFFHNFPSRAKPILFSSVMSSLGLTGIYTYYTGEANVNAEYPDYTLTYVIAHEFAHQRGINRENEANFMAYLVCIASPDPYVRYSGYLNMYEYLISALYRADEELYYKLSEGLDIRARDDIRASNAVTLKYRDGFLFEVSHSINDAYLQINGTPGSVSYGYVVRLAVSYYEKAE